MRAFLVWLMLCCASVAMPAQSTYTGSVKDSAGNAVVNGEITFTPVHDIHALAVAVSMPDTIACHINADGSLSGFVQGKVSGACVVTAQVGLQYRVCVKPDFSLAGPCFFYFLKPGSMDVSTMIPDYIRQKTRPSAK